MSSKTRQRKAQRELQRKRQQQMYIVIGIVIVAIVAVVLVAFSSQPLAGPVDAALANRYEGIERGVTDEGFPVLGSPDAPVEIAEYSAFTCPHCADFHDNQFAQLLDDIRAGQVRFVYVPVNLSQGTVPATAAGFCAAEQGRFWEMHDALFGWLRQYGGAAYAQARLIAGAQELGMDTDAFSACLNSEETRQKMDAADTAFRDLIQQYEQVTGTPTLTFNGEPPEFGSGGPSIDYIRQRIAELSGQAGS